MYRHWLVAHDFDACSDSAAYAACEIARTQSKNGEARVVLVHVVNAVPLVITPDVMGLPDINANIAAEHEAALSALERRANLLRVRFPDVDISSHLRAGVVVDTLLDEAERLKVDAIAVGSHGRRGITRALLGSTSESTSRRAKIPVFVVKPEAGAEATL